MDDIELYSYCVNNANTYIILVWPVTNNFDTIIREVYGKYGNIIAKREFSQFNNELSINALLSPVADKIKHPYGSKLWFAEPYRYNNPLTMYVFQTKPQNVPDDHKVNYIVKIFNNNSLHVKGIAERNGGLNDLYCTTKAKLECRKKLIENGCVADLPFAPDKQYSHHVNDEHRETISLAQIFLNKNTLELLPYFKYNLLEKFNTKVDNFIKFLIVNKVNVNNILIYNSGCLGPLGLREPADIDFLQGGDEIIKQNQLPPDIDIQNKFFKRGYMIMEYDGHAQYMEDHQSKFINIPIDKFTWTLSINDIIYNSDNYYYYRGLKFMSLPLFVKVKRIRGRKKDLEQVEKFFAFRNKLVFEKMGLDVKNCIMVSEMKKTCHYRLVIKDSNFYYKAVDFNRSCDRKFLVLLYSETFQKAVDQGFYNGVAIDGVVFHHDPEYDVWYIKYPALNDIIHKDFDKYNDLRQRLVNQSIKHNIMYTDFNWDNVKEYNGVYYLIDLETVTSITNYRKWMGIHYENDNIYENKVFASLNSK